MQHPVIAAGGLHPGAPACMEALSIVTEQAAPLDIESSLFKDGSGDTIEELALAALLSIMIV